MSGLIGGLKYLRGETLPHIEREIRFIAMLIYIPAGLLSAHPLATPMSYIFTCGEASRSMDHVRPCVFKCREGSQGPERHGNISNLVH